MSSGMELRRQLQSHIRRHKGTVSTVQYSNPLRKVQGVFSMVKPHQIPSSNTILWLESRSISEKNSEMPSVQRSTPGRQGILQRRSGTDCRAFLLHRSSPATAFARCAETRPILAATGHNDLAENKGLPSHSFPNCTSSLRTHHLARTKPFHVVSDWTSSLKASSLFLPIADRTYQTRLV
jgi:hypothetical protein